MNQSMKTLIAALILIWSCIPTQTAFSQTNFGKGAETSGVKPEGMLTVQVQTLDGKPMTNVSVVCIGQETNAVLKGTIIEGGGQRLLTDDQGNITLTWNGKKYWPDDCQRPGLLSGAEPGPDQPSGFGRATLGTD
jgi:hypothetical protein